jgi:glycosyltransferase involved in cell wall biosynthesis
MNKSVILLPSRGRSHRIDECLESLLENTVASDIIVCLDEDDAASYSRVDGVEYHIGPKPTRIGLNEKLNRMLPLIVDKYDYIMWAADDTVAKTPGWDARLVAAIENIPLGISYPNDLLQGKNLPSNGTCFDSRIPRALGYLAPPTLFHLYMDNFWRLLGTELGTLVYCEDIILEHNHYVNKKAPTDNTYKTINSQEMYSLDSSAFNDYKDNLLTRDLARLHASLETE